VFFYYKRSCKIILKIINDKIKKLLKNNNNNYKILIFFVLKWYAINFNVIIDIYNKYKLLLHVLLVLIINNLL